MRPLSFAARLLGTTSDALLKGASPGQRIPRDGTLLGALFDSLVTLSVRAYADAAEARVGHLRTHRGEHEWTCSQNGGTAPSWPWRSSLVPRADGIAVIPAALLGP